MEAGRRGGRRRRCGGCCSPGRRPGNPGLGRCGARGPASQAGTRATAGLRPWLL